MAANYIPDSESDLVTWLTNFQSKFEEDGTGCGFTLPEVTALGTLVETFTSEYETNLATQADAKTARERKDVAKASLLAQLRPTVARLQTSPTITDIIRTRLGITLKDTVRTTTSAAAVAQTCPIAKVNTAMHLQHTIDFRDSTHEDRRGKPAGIKGCEIWIKIAQAPSELVGGGDPADMRFLALDTATPYVMQFAQADAGKNAYYAVRWIANDGTKSPWGEIVQATIVG